MRVFKGQYRLKLVTIMPVLALALSACGGEEAPKNNATFLHVSVSDFYFGTRNVGTTATQKIELSNRSGDIYPLNRLTLKGVNADEFNTNFGGGITLNPGQKVAVDVSFTPLTNGPKNAVLDVDYEVITQVTEEDNLNEQVYYEARDLESAGEYSKSGQQYNEYLSNKPVTLNKKRAEIKLPVLSEADRHGAGEELDQYLQAINSRHDGASAESLETLEALVESYPDSYLADDALYLQGYIQLLDYDDPGRATDTMADLRKQYPDSTYFDTALYSEAIAYEQLGDATAARKLFDQLIARHKSETWARINLNMPKDDFVSRLWFQRASDGLARLDA
ncbi:MAG: tetratricopeptide repeat protein [Granulosicoccus sp.]|nr:tetratricopeptide repeat protein [Granulosicoccus sp.]